MTDDLVFRLKQMEEFFHLDYHCIKKIGREAANRIENLEAALRAIIDRAEFRMGHNVTDDVCALARKALEGKDD
jgi:hypothetical protein